VNEGVSGKCAIGNPLDRYFGDIVCYAYIFYNRAIDGSLPFPNAGAMNSMTQPNRENAAEQADFDVGRLDEIIGFHLRMAHGSVYRHFTETFSELDLTQKQVSVLWLIEDHPDIAQADIGRLLQMDRATVMAIVNRLQKRGFVERGDVKEDRRRQTLHLTEAGREALVSAREAILEHENWLKSRFTPGETAMLIELLRRIHD
jgi:DNA-binding MarR family transcriptional regulator